MGTTNQFIGGVFIVFVLTGLISLLARKRKIGSLPVWGIGFLTGFILLFVPDFEIIGTGLPLILQLILIFTSPKKNSIDALLKLNEAKEKGLLTEEEFAIQKRRLMK